jgi:hypothetical protein
MLAEDPAYLRAARYGNLLLAPELWGLGDAPGCLLGFREDLF